MGRLWMAAAISLGTWGCSESTRDARTTDDFVSTAAGSARVSDIVNRVSAILGDEAGEFEGGVYVDFRDGGLRRQHVWVFTRNPIASLEKALREILKDGNLADPIDAIMIDFVRHYRDVNLEAERGPLTNAHRGVHGIELRYGDAISRWSPLEMIAFNRSFDGVIDRFAETNGVGRDAVGVRVFPTRSLFVSLEPETDVHELFRGNQLVEIGELRLESVEALAAGMGDWLTRQVHDDGRMTYKYWPSRGEESTGNNMIRQFMATVALGRWARYSESDEVARKHLDNLNYNLEHFYHVEGTRAFIEYNGKVKLGAVALACLSIVESPTVPIIADAHDSMLRFVDRMRNADGSFTGWYRGQPPGANSGQNFYPGEALLLWASLYEDQPDPELLKKIMRSFAFYRTWHRADRNPAFVPWHTQAYYKVWRQTKDPALRDFIFEMNDWLVEYQQWDGVAYDDMRGRFYDPKRRGYGPPHASSTGVYLEGLIDAYSLAEAVGDGERAESYRVAILRGLRSVMQLQFADEIDLFYISKRDQVRGSIRTTIYNNEIRVDNVQHNLMAVLEIMGTFSEEDYVSAN